MKSLFLIFTQLFYISVHLRHYGAYGNLCTTCRCSIDKITTLIDCTSKQISNLDWDLAPKKSMDVDFEDNQLQEINLIPKFSIVRLSFKNNNISNIQDEAFQKLKHLSYLDLSYNQLFTLSKDIFKGPHRKNKGFPSPILGKSGFVQKVLKK